MMIEPATGNVQPATRLSSRSLRYALCAMLILCAFIAGYHWRGAPDREFQRGYDAAAAHISQVIREKMDNAELSPFYIADIGVHFYPRGKTIATLKFRPTVEDPSELSPVPKYRPVKAE